VLKKKRPLDETNLQLAALQIESSAWSNDQRITHKKEQLMVAAAWGCLANQPINSSWSKDD
jgi:hypothetical protein